MDRDTARLLLESYRPQDADDPVFAEALRVAAADPELAAWFQEVQRTDAAISAQLQAVPVPPEVKSHILLGLHAAAAEKPRRARVWPLIGSIAALLVAGLIVWPLLHRPPRPAALLAQQAISFTEEMPRLQFVCFDAGAVAAWINRQPAAHSLAVSLPSPPPSLSMKLIGSSIVDWNGHPVVMVCLQDQHRMAMLYILQASDAAALPEGATETVTKGDWVVRSTKANGQVRLLAAKGKPRDLDFAMPF